MDVDEPVCTTPVRCVNQHKYIVGCPLAPQDNGAKSKADPVTDNYKYGVMFNDGSVMARWNGRTQRQRAYEEYARCKAEYSNDNIRFVRRLIGNWEEV